MPIFPILIVMIAIGSVGFCLLTLERFWYYNKKYYLQEFTPEAEKKYTRLFGVINRRQVAIAYVVFTGLHLILTLWFLWTL